MTSVVSGWMALFLSLLPQQANHPAKAEPAYRISGVVVDAVSGQPIARAELVLFLGSIEPTEISSSTISGSDGKFTFENLTPGKYTLRAQRRGYAPQAYLQHENYWSGIAVGPGMDTEKIRFQLLPSASISGQVLEEAGDPVRKAVILLVQQGVQEGRRSTRLAERVISDDEGRFRFGHMLPGNYIVGVNAEPWYSLEAPQLEYNSDGMFDRTFRVATSSDPVFDVIYPMTFFPGSRDLSGAELIHLHAGDSEKADVHLQPVPSSHLKLRIHADDETTRSNVLVTQSIADGIEAPVRIYQRAVSPGVVEISGLPSGHLNIRVDSRSGNSRTVRNESVDLSGSMELDATRALAQRSVSGVVKMEDGGALSSNAVVQLRNPENGAVYLTRVAPGGEFSFDNNPIGMTASAFEISVTQPADSFLKAVKASGAKAFGSRVEFEEGTDVRLEVILGKGVSSINGVALRENKPASGAMILLLPDDFQNNTQRIRRDQSDTDGTFTLKQVPPGKYTILAIEKGWELEWMNPEVLRKYLPEGTRIEVQADTMPDVKLKVQ